MKQFSVLRYLKKFRWLIFAFAVGGSLLVFAYGSSRQTYEASAVMRYSGGEIPEEMREVYSTAIIDAALDELGYDTVGVDDIRSRFRVDPVVSESNQTMVDAILESGRKPDFEPDTYRVSFKSDDENFAFSVLDAVIKNYYRYYTEQYETGILGENGTDMLDISGFDFVESVQTLEKSVADMITFLDAKRAVQPEARSIKTGCSYQDLYEAFRYLYLSEIPRLYMSVLGGSSSTEADVLVARLERNCDRLREKITARAQEIEYQKELMDNFAGRSEEIFDFQRGDGAVGENFILDETKYADSGSARTTYDSLMYRYISLRNEYESYVIELDTQEFLLKIFMNSSSMQLSNDSADSGDDAENTEDTDLAAVFAYAAEGAKLSADEIQALIDRCAGLYAEYYDLTDRTSEELNSVLSAKYLTTVGSIDVEPSIQLVRYAIIALALFLVLGVLIAVVLGRGIEIVENLLYHDRNVDLPNRASCDQYIEKRESAILPDNFACVTMQLDLRKITAQYGREIGDKALSDFGSILKGFKEAFGYIAHNGSGQFIAFFNECSRSKLDAILYMLRTKTDEYNSDSEHVPVEYSAGTAITSETGVYSIRPLIQAAMRNRLSPGEGSETKSGAAKTSETDNA